MNQSTRSKAHRAAQISHELYRLLDELSNELANREDHVGWLHVIEVKDAVYGRKSAIDMMSKLDAVASMGQGEKGECKETATPTTAATEK